MTVESDNAREEARDIVEKCIRCGKCKVLCPVFKIIREEQQSPRGRAILLDNNHFDKFVYNCTLCRACENKCPLGIKLCNAFIKARKVLVGQKKEIEANKEIIKNLQKTGNIYGIKEEKE
jgi:glycolate oxidase iron-sulfur subunit